MLIPIAASCETCSRNSDNDLGTPPSWDDDCDSGMPSLTDRATEKEVKELLDSLPRNLHKDKEQQQQQQQNADHATLSAKQLDTLAEEESTLVEEEGDDLEEEGLVVAWQYRKEVQQERLGLSNVTATGSSRSNNNTGAGSAAAVYCHSYDLQGRLADQMNVEATIVPVGCCCECCHHTTRQNCGFQYFRQLIQQLETIMAEQPRKVIRVLLYHPDTASLAIALPLFLNHIRSARLPVVVLVTVQPWTVAVRSKSTAATAQLRHLRRSADAVLETESFVGRHTYPPPPEFRHLHGLLRIRKASTCTLAASVGHFANLTVQKRPAAVLYGLRRDRRKLHLTLLHIPPEDYAADGGSVGAGAVRSGAGRRTPATSAGGGAGGCGSSGGGSLDF